METKNFLILLFLMITMSSLPLSFTQIAQPMADPKIDPQLIEICKITKEPELCLQSYFVYPGEDHPDANISARAVLRKEFEVAKKMSLELYTQSINFSSRHYGKNNKLYGMFDRCSRMFVLASNELICAKEALIKFNDLDEVKVGVNVAVDRYRTCYRSLGRDLAPPLLHAERLYKMADICLSLATSIH